MRKKVFLIAMAALLLVTGWTVHQPKPGGVRQVWEYKSIAGSGDAFLNQMGAQGWELVTVYNNGEGRMFYFKRPQQ